MEMPQMNIGIYQEPTFLITNLNSHKYLFLRRMSSPVYSGLPFPASCRDVRQSRDKGRVPPESIFEKKRFISRERFFITNCAGMVGNELWTSMRWMAFVWNSVQRFSFMAAIGTAARIVINAQGRCCARALWEEGKRFSRRVLNWLSVGSTKSKMFRGVSAMLYKSIEKF